MRYADPAVDAFVRDDLVKVIALREDLAFILGDGTQDTPRGFLSFAGAYAVTGGGAAGVFSTTGNSTAASGGNFITPIFGPPKTIQGRVRALNGRSMVVQAGTPVHVELPAEASAVEMANGPISVGSLVNVVAFPGATFELVK